MDEQEEEIRGPATLNDFQGIINEFATSHTQSQRAYEVGGACAASSHLLTYCWGTGFIGIGHSSISRPAPTLCRVWRSFMCGRAVKPER